MPFTPEDLSIDLLNRATGANTVGGIASVAKPLATHNTGNLLKGIMGALGVTGNPYLAALSIGLPLVGGLWDSFTESPRERLEKEIFQARRERLGETAPSGKGALYAGGTARHSAGKRAGPQPGSDQHRPARIGYLRCCVRGIGSSGASTVSTGAATRADTAR